MCQLQILFPFLFIFKSSASIFADTSIQRNQCALHAFNGQCVTHHHIMKVNCPNWCEDYASSTFQCQDDPKMDCKALAASGFCSSDFELYSDFHCPLSCGTCPDQILLQRNISHYLSLPDSSFARRRYLDSTSITGDDDNSSLKSTSESQPSISTSDDEEEEIGINNRLKVYNDLHGNVTTAINIKEFVMSMNGESELQVQHESESSSDVSASAIELREIDSAECSDTDYDMCRYLVESNQCDDYPAWISRNCAKSCGDCDGKRSAAVLKETAFLLQDDGSGCVDLHADCFERIRDGKCETFEVHMTTGCRRSCRLCSPLKPDPDVEEAHNQYFRRLGRQDRGDICSDRRPDCRTIKRENSCEKEKPYMYTQCARTCRTCEYMDKSKLCTRSFLNISDVPAFGPGEIGQMFRNMQSEYGDRYPITVLSTSPWVVTIDNFISDDEIIAMHSGVNKWYESQSLEHLHDFNFMHKARANVGWCFQDCDTASHAVLRRISMLTGVPSNNIENFQMLEYSGRNHFYPVHHDYFHGDIHTPAGNRVLSIELYFSDVEVGGQTEFPKLGIQIAPKVGRAAIWVNVLDSDPTIKDIRTINQVNPILNQIKYGAYTGMHMYDIRTSNDWNCQGGYVQ